MKADVNVENYVDKFAQHTIARSIVLHSEWCKKDVIGSLHLSPPRDREGMLSDSIVWMVYKLALEMWDCLDEHYILDERQIKKEFRSHFVSFFCPMISNFSDVLKEEAYLIDVKQTLLKVILALFGHDQCQEDTVEVMVDVEGSITRSVASSTEENDFIIEQVFTRIPRDYCYIVSFQQEEPGFEERYESILKKISLVLPGYMAYHPNGIVPDSYAEYF